jgi:hypothetical protein
MRQDWESRQGRVLSPILFNVILDEICNKIREKLKERDLKAFIHADDIMIHDEDVKELQTRLNHWERVRRNRNCK